jgi:DnaJ-like protein C11, C-terminal
LGIGLKGNTETRVARFVLPVVALLLVATLVTTTQAQPQIGKLEIVKAFYGKGGHGNDVTRKLQRMIQNDTLDVKVTNDNLGGDPNVGADKSLKVDYTYRGQTLHETVQEGKRLQLP